MAGLVKRSPEDFVVEEISQYAPSGEGNELFLRIVKRRLSTFAAVRALAQGLGIQEREIGYAGLKDRRAVTTQTVSVPASCEDRLGRVRVPGLRILWSRRHHERIRVGHLIGNRFRIRLRDTRPEDRDRFYRILEVLRDEGVPNFFGRQRFGFRENSHILGHAIVRQDYEAFLAEFLGRPHPGEDAACRRARELWEKGRAEEALKAFLPEFPNEAKALSMWIKTGGDGLLAYNAIPRKNRQFYVSAYQSLLFNALLDQRLLRLNRMETGDIVLRQEGNELFQILEPAAWEPDLRRFDISVTGPIFGAYTRLAGGVPGQRERDLLRQEGVEAQAFLDIHGFIERGTRRPLRFPIRDLEARFGSREANLVFSLPKGCYATSLLDELQKT